jgi:hypothetical protein
MDVAVCARITEIRGVEDMLVGWRVGGRVRDWY